MTQRLVSVPLSEIEAEALDQLRDGSALRDFARQLDDAELINEILRDWLISHGLLDMRLATWGLRRPR